MSRIEQALEKAAMLRGTTAESGPVAVPRQTDDVPPRERAGLPPFPAEPLDGIRHDNPLLATLNDPHSYVSEEYRKLKSAIVAGTSLGEFRNTVMITSTLGGEGKSITALNLAITLAQEYDNTVLLIDADLRKPMTAEYLGIPGERGLSEYLSVGAHLPELLVRTGIGRLSILPAGKPAANPVELLSSQRMKDLLDEIRHRYPDRYVIIDAPPALPFAEVRSLSSIVDSIVFVVREGQSSLANIDEAIGALNRKKIIGIVFNEASAVGLSSKYGYGYGYGGYGHRSEPAEARSKAEKTGKLARIMGKGGSK